MKRLEPDYCILRNCDVRQARTARERAFSNGHHAARYCDVCQAITFCKRKMADSVYAVRDRDAGQTAAIVERAVSDFFQVIWQVNIYKRRAFGKRITSDFGYSIWKHDAGQAAATVERKRINEHHAFRYRNARQAIAIKKRTVADALNFLPVIDRRDFDIDVGASSDSGNRTGSVSVGHELQTFRAFVQGCSGGEDSGGFHGGIPFFPWRSSLGVMPYALGVTISAGTVLCVSHPGLEPAMAALRWHG